VFVSRYQNAGQNHSIKTAKKFFENVEKLKYRIIEKELPTLRSISPSILVT